MTNIGYYLVRNAMPTASDAPYLVRVVPTGVANFNDVIADVLEAVPGTESRFRMIWAETIRVALQHALEGETVDLGGIRIRLHIPESMDYEDSPFDAKSNTLVVEAYADAELADAFANVLPRKLTAEAVKAAIKFSNLMDVETEEFNVIHGTNPFVALGNSITLDAEGESLKILSKKTGEVVATATVSTVSKGQRATCTLPAGVETGDYIAQLTTFGLVGESTPRVFRKAVKVIAAPAPTGPTITKVTSDGPVEDDHLAVSKNHVLGTGLALGEGDHVYLRLIDTDGTVLEDNSQDHRVASSTDAEITSGDSGFWPDDSEYPDGEWDEEGRTVKLRVVKADGTAAERRVYLDDGE